MCEHLLCSLVEILRVLICVIGKCVARRASPEQILTLCIEQIDDERTDLVGLSCCCCVSESSKSSPTPTPSKAVVKRVESLLILRDLDRHDTDITTRVDLRPAFGCQSPIYRVLNAVDHQGI